MFRTRWTQTTCTWRWRESRKCSSLCRSPGLFRPNSHIISSLRYRMRRRKYCFFRSCPIIYMLGNLKLRIFRPTPNTSDLLTVIKTSFVVFLPNNNIMVFHCKLVIHRKMNVLIPPSFSRNWKKAWPSFVLAADIILPCSSFSVHFPGSGLVTWRYLSFGYMSCYVIEDVFVFVLLMFLPVTRVADPHHFNADQDPAFHFNADPDPAPIKVLGIFGH